MRARGVYARYVPTCTRCGRDSGGDFAFCPHCGAQLAGRTWGLGYYTELLPGIVAELDPTRFYCPSSPYSPVDGLHPNDANHGTRHDWQVWNEVDYTHYRDHVPRFCSEFGFQGPPAWSTLTRWIHDQPLPPSSPSFLTHQKAEDGNGKLDVTTLTREGWSFLWKTDVDACAGSNGEWWTFHHDEHSTANYGHDGRPPAKPARVKRRVRGRDLVLTFRAPGDDLFCGKVAKYEVRAGRKRLKLAKPSIVEGRKRQPEENHALHHRRPQHARRLAGRRPFDDARRQPAPAVEAGLDHRGRRTRARRARSTA